MLPFLFCVSLIMQFDQSIRYTMTGNKFDKGCNMIYHVFTPMIKQARQIEFGKVTKIFFK